MIRSLAAAAIVFMLLALNACSPWATYPPVETKMAQSMTRETFEPVPTVMAVALQYARDKYYPEQDVAINLPAGTPAMVYDKVIKKLGWGHPLVIPDDVALFVSEVRTRSFNGQVDLIHRRTDGLYEMVTISMSRGPVNKYKVDGFRIWQWRNLQAPMPNYVEPPASQPAK